MFHSITIWKSQNDSKNTWDDWHLIPTSRPYVSPPAVNEKYVDIPGRNGALDLTTVLTGSPTYSNRKGSWEFYVVCKNTDILIPGGGYLTAAQQNALWTDWVAAYETIMNWLHGQTVTVRLEDDPNYYYSGRLKVNSFAPNKDFSTISIDYTFGPLKSGATDKF